MVDILSLLSAVQTGVGSYLMVFPIPGSKIPTLVLFTSSLMCLCSLGVEMTCAVGSAYWRTRVLYVTTILLWVWHVVVERVLNGMGSSLTFVGAGLAIISLIVSILTIAVICILPVPSLRSPTGKHKRLGTLSFNIYRKSDNAIKRNGAQIPVGGDNDMSTIPVQCWFPIVDRKTSAASGSAFVPMVQRFARLWTSGDPSHEETEAILLLETMADSAGLPQWALHHLMLSLTHSEHQFDLSQIKAPTPLPVAVYSHGMHGWRQVHTCLCEELASQGFLVFSVDHSPCSTLARPHLQLHTSTVFDFKLPPNIPDSLTPEGKQFYCDGIDRRVRDLTALLEFISSPPAAARVQQDNGTHVLDFSPVADLSRVHACGHSFGGATVACWAARDARVSSTVVLDGWYYPISDSDMNHRTKAHTMLLSSQDWPISKVRMPEKVRMLNGCYGGKALNLVVRNSNHQNFCDFSYFASWFALRYKPDCLGVVSVSKSMDAICLLTVGFFNHIDATCGGRDPNNENDSYAKYLRTVAAAQANGNGDHHDDKNGSAVLSDVLTQFLGRALIHDANASARVNEVGSFVKSTIVEASTVFGSK